MQIKYNCCREFRAKILPKNDHSFQNEQIIIKLPSKKSIQHLRMAKHRKNSYWNIPYKDSFWMVTNNVNIWHMYDISSCEMSINWNPSAENLCFNTTKTVIVLLIFVKERLNPLRK